MTWIFSLVFLRITRRSSYSSKWSTVERCAFASQYGRNSELYAMYAGQPSKRYLRVAMLSSLALCACMIRSCWQDVDRVNSKRLDFCSELVVGRFWATNLRTWERVCWHLMLSWYMYYTRIKSHETKLKALNTSIHLWTFFWVKQHVERLVFCFYGEL